MEQAKNRFMQADLQPAGACHEKAEEKCGNIWSAGMSADSGSINT